MCTCLISIMPRCWYVLVCGLAWGLARVLLIAGSLRSQSGYFRSVCICDSSCPLVVQASSAEGFSRNLAGWGKLPHTQLLMSGHEACCRLVDTTQY